jgi:hypothetical protein
MTQARLCLARGFAAWLCLALGEVLSCTEAPPRTPSWVHPTSSQWQRAAASLDRLRSEARFAYVASVRTSLHEPKTGRIVDGRGAVAVVPGQGMRMILVGAAGATVLDAWVTPTRWRVAVPPLEFVRRGGMQEPEDLPIGFWRWWFLTPLEGTLFAAAMTGADSHMLLREGDATVELVVGICSAGQRIAAARRVKGRTERVDACRARALPASGDSVHYVDETSGLEVDVVVESASDRTASAAALRDPDAQEGGP